MSITTAITDTAVFLNLSEELLDQGYAVRFRATGTSMRPTIEDGDAITVARVPAGVVKRGDILLYRRGGRAVAHRVVDIQTAGTEIAAFVLRGDAKAACDAPIAPNQLVGKVVAVEAGSPRTANSWRAKVGRWLRAGSSSRGSADSRILDLKFGSED